eukprot:TRINITY_DN3452_c0_g1_i1.p1 TRINITY_DN3452_c0_g1~~TRINITY_DN3452_c0_g1_i1.p1  ORF type:complete len:195 (-),score=15.72 TRINITY_DN3452_c0_g1_i1:44-628(-)
MHRFLRTFLLAISLIVIADARLTTLTKSNFEDEVGNGNGKPWLIQFHAPWCDSCKRQIDVLENVYQHYKGKIGVGKIDGIHEFALNNRFNAKQYPSTYYVYQGNVYEYDGGLTLLEIVEFIDKGYLSSHIFTAVFPKHGDSIPPREFSEIMLSIVKKHPILTTVYVIVMSGIFFCFGFMIYEMTCAAKDSSKSE